MVGSKFMALLSRYSGVARVDLIVTKLRVHNYSKENNF